MAGTSAQSNLKQIFVSALEEMHMKLRSDSHNFDTMNMVYKKAVAALKCHRDEDIESIYDLKKVTGIGQAIMNTLVRYFTSKHMLEIVENGKSPNANRINNSNSNKRASGEPDNTGITKKKRKITNKKPYIPKVRSGAYAILLALLENIFSLHNSMVKEEITEFGGRYCDSSFQSNASTNDYFSAWSAMKQLLTKNLAEELNGKKRPQRYGLTREGIVLAATLKKIHSLKFDREGEANEYVWIKQWNRYYKKLMEDENQVPNQELLFMIANENDSNAINDTSVTNNSKSTLDMAHGRHRNMLLRDLLNEHQPAYSSLLSLSNSNRSLNNSFELDLCEEKNNKISVADDFENISLGLFDNISNVKGYFNQIPYETWSCKSYEIILLIDTREIRSVQDRDFFTSELSKKGVKVETRQLNLGDFIWIARHIETKKEVFLNCIIERKRIDDLCNSIRDRRFYEQKQRLNKTGYKWCFYIVEESLLNNRLLNMMEAIKTSFFEVTLQAGFILQRTKGSSETVSFLMRLHKLISKRLLFNKKSILVIKANEFETQQEFKDKLVTFRAEFEKPIVIKSSSKSLVLFECCHQFTNFQAVMGKSTFTTARQMYLNALISVKGCSVEKALTIQSRYSSFSELIQGYNNCKSKKESEMLLYDRFDLYPTHKKIGKSLSEKFHESFGKKKF
ncbi:hypothetical protein QEN19_002350 [Hanseniaspora menglaensis]